MFLVSVLSALLLLLAGASDFANCQSITLNLAYIAANKNTPNNCWILITNYIYDMTQYIDLHPAGPTYITNNCGKDASAAYNGQNAHAKVSPIANVDGIINMGRVGTVITPTTAPTTPVPTTKPVTTKPPTLPAGGGGTTITLSLAYIAANRALPGNCWVAISSYVYDLSAYVHGGGASYINANCGKDATAAYQAQPSFHQTTSVPMPPKAGITRMGVLGSTITIGGGGVTTVIPTLPPTSAPTQGGGGGTTTVTLNANYVAQKNTATNCWIILNNNVYDMSKYAHPGGASFITSNCGKDATTAYLAQTVHTPTKLTKTQGLVLVGAVGTSIQVVTLTANYIAQYRATPNSNCWIIISNNVYDMTTYASKHGGGQAFVNGQCGKDATTAYTGQAGVHTPTQLATKTILIGTVGATVPLVAGSGSGPATQAPPATLPPNTGGSGVKKTVTLTPDYIKSTRSNSGVSCWIIFNNYVFDLTQYSHPAGASYITGACGSDATGAYTGQAAHSFTRLPTATAVGTSSAGTILYKGAVGDSIQIDSNDQGSASGKMATKSWVQNNTIAFVCIVVAVGGLITLVVLHLASSWYHRRRLARDANTKSNLAMANRV